MKRKRIYAACLALLVLAAAAVLLVRRGWADTSRFQEKAELLRQEALADWMRLELGSAPAGEAGFAVFLSVSDGIRRTDVWTGTGSTADKAWENAVQAADAALRRSGQTPEWVKADVVYVSGAIPAEELAAALSRSEAGCFRYGAALDPAFRTALLEAELNSAEIYDYEAGGLDLEALNRYLKAAGRKPVRSLPEEYWIFQCAGWLCDGAGDVWPLSASGLDYGRRRPETVDGDYARALIRDAAGYLMNQVREDGTFRQSAASDGEASDIRRHAGALWALVRGYDLNPGEALAEKIRLAADGMLSQVRYDSAGRAFLDEEAPERNGLAVAALTEYMEVFQSREYEEVCLALGQGILAMPDQDLNGEAAFALCRLYGLTGEQAWLDAAERAAGCFIAADDTRDLDPWAAYSVNELTKYIQDNPDYYAFGLRYAQARLEDIRNDKTASPAGLELLMAAFELYTRMNANGGTAQGFDLPALLSAIQTRAERQLNGMFYPEYAMYMEHPQEVLGAFMVREERFQVPIDGVQHSIGGYDLYCRHYEELVRYGLPV